jgi:hypothetical protein
VAHNYAGRSVPFRVGGQDLTRPFYWTGPSGDRLLVWQTDTPHGVAYMDGTLVGMAENEEVARSLLPEYLAELASKPYPYGKHAFGWHDLPADIPVTKQPYPHDIVGFRVQSVIADNAAPSLAISETVRSWNEAWAFPTIKLSIHRTFFEELVKRLEGKIDSFSGDWTDWWVDGVGSGAFPLGLNRRAQGAVRTEQTLHALADCLSGESLAPVDETNAVYEAMALFDEHTWGAANPWRSGRERMDSGDRQWHRKAGFAHEAFERSIALLESGLYRFATQFTKNEDALASVIVVNPSGFQRSEIVRVFVPVEQVPLDGTFRLVAHGDDASVPFVIEPQGHDFYRAKGQWITFAAHDVPPVGYAQFDLLADDRSTAEEPALGVADPFVLESPSYRVAIDPRDGFIAEIIDKESGRDLVNAEAPFGFNEYIYDRYTSSPAFNHLSGRIEDRGLALFGSRSTGAHPSIVRRWSNSVEDAVTIRLTAEGCHWLETTITLPKGVKQIWIENRLDKIATLDKESVFFAFPFAVADTDPEYSITGGISSQQAPHVPGSARHMFAIRDWVAMHDQQGSAAWATLEAPLIELGDIALPYSPFPSTIAEERQDPATIYSWAMNNLWDTNFPPQQGGEQTFNYVIGSSASQEARNLGMAAAASVSAPMVGAVLPRTSGSTASDLPARGSFLEVSDPLVEVVHLAPSSNPDELVAYLHSLADDRVNVRLTSPLLQVSPLRAESFLGEKLADLKDETVEIEPGAFIAVVLKRSEEA